MSPHSEKPGLVFRVVRTTSLLSPWLSLCHVKHVNSSPSQGSSGLILTQAISHLLVGILQSTSIAHLHCQQQTLQVPCSAACGRALLHQAVTLLRCPLEVCTSTTPMKTQGKLVTRGGGGRCGLPSACALLWVRPTSPLTLCAGLLQRTFTER